MIFEAPSHSTLLEKTGVKQLVSDVIDELISLATAQGCSLPADFKQKTIDEQTRNTDNPSIMWQDYVSRRPMEVETFLGSPIKLAQSVDIKLPRIETLYAILHNINIVNQSRPKEVIGIPQPPTSPGAQSIMPRMSSVPPPRPVPNGMPNGNGMARGPRPRNSSNFTGPPPGMRRPPPMNGGPPIRPSTTGGPNGYPQARQPSRRGSIDEHDLGEFSHLVLYDDPVDAADSASIYPADASDIALRERELQIRQRELALKEQELRMRRGGGPAPRRRGGGGGGAPMRNGGGGHFDDDDEEDDFFDPNSAPSAPMIDPDNFDMMSVTSRKNRSKPPPSHSDLRSNPEGPGPMMPPRGNRWRPGFGRNRSSQIMTSTVPGLHDNILDDPLMGYSSNRYGDVDRGQMHQGSRANSLTASHLHELQGPGMSGPYPRRASQSPGNPYSPSIRGNGRPSPPNGVGGPGPNGRPSPPDGMRQPIPRYPPGHGNSVAPQQVEQRVGVSTLQPPKPKTVRSLTGSASASAESGESSHVDSDPSAHSSQSSLGPRPPIGVR